MNDDVFRGIDLFLSRSLYLKKLKKRTEKAMGYSHYLSRSITWIASFFQLFRIVDSLGNRGETLLFFSHSITRYQKDGEDINRFVYPFVSAFPDLPILNIEDGYIKTGLKQNRLYREFSVLFILEIIRAYVLFRRVVLNSIARIGFEIQEAKLSQEVVIYAKLYKLLLKVVRPKLVFTINWYSPKGLALILAAHELCIRVVDIQHGLAAASKHRCYTNLSIVSDALRPDYFLCWTDRDAELLNKDLDSNIAFSVGSLSLHKVNRLQAAETISSSDNILITLGVRIPNWYAILVGKLHAMGINSTVRPHPSFPVIDEELKIVDTVRIDTEGTFAESLFTKPICVLGEWSATLVEASLEGVPAISIGSEGAEYFESYDSIICSRDAEDALDRILDLKDKHHAGEWFSARKPQDIKVVVHELLSRVQSY